MLVITLGDPYSINQLCLVRLDSLWAARLPGPVVFVGSWAQWQHQQQAFQFPSYPWKHVKEWSEITAPGLYFLAIDGEEKAVVPSALTALERGNIASRALQSLARGPKPSAQLAVLTAPIDKHACALAGFAYPGQTEFFEQIWGGPGIMLLAGSRLRVALATNHLPLAAVTAAIDAPLLLRKLSALHETLEKTLGCAKPRIGVAALNPHAGDGGLFGREDELILAPAVAEARRRGLDVSGPYPADTLFFQAYQGTFDAVLAMYHDQGLGPLKTVHFYDAVNITGGLSALRVSPDHGPAAGLYGKEEAREDSFRLALQHALRYLGW